MKKIRVFIVDDSTLYRSQIRAALADQPDVEVVGFASDGRNAVDLLKSREVDVITLDMEMPVLDGLGLLRELKKLNISTHIIVFSALTKSGAELTLNALQLGASDFLLKPQLEANSTVTPAAAIRAVLLPKIRLSQQRGRASSAVANTVAVVSAANGTFPKLNWKSLNPQAVVIASSTGGPAALEKIFAEIRGPLTCPVFVAQHMPPIFTATLAERLQKISGLPVKEGVHGMKVEKGHVYVAPGDYHMTVEDVGGVATISLNQAPLRNSVRPCANFLFESAAAKYRNAVVGVVLTGMGEDGRDGAVAIKNAGGGVLIQDQASSVVFGMPGSVFAAQAFDRMSSLDEIAMSLAELAICSYQKAA